ncbi:MAG: hypothetical protein ABIT76_04750 [Chthoniobacterales bacterium]
MSRFFFLILTLALAASPLRADDDQTVAARSAAFDLAGAFSANDGYKLRDGFFSAKLKKGESKVFTVNLYAGNSYWFCTATAPAVKKMEVTLYDETGKVLPIQPFVDGARAAAGITAAYSGTYYVKISVVDGGSESSTACLLYAYK